MNETNKQVRHNQLKAAFIAASRELAEFSSSLNLNEWEMQGCRISRVIKSYDSVVMVTDNGEYLKYTARADYTEIELDSQMLSPRELIDLGLAPEDLLKKYNEAKKALDEVEAEDKVSREIQNLIAKHGAEEIRKHVNPTTK